MPENRICQMLSIKYPVIQAAMTWVTNAELVAAVSNAGGLGVFGPNAGERTVATDAIETAERLRRQIRKARSLTDKPFGVNIMSFPQDETFSDHCARVVVEEGVAAAITCGTHPERYIQMLKDGGLKVLHRPLPDNNVEAARKYAGLGIDALIAVGFEGGGHTGDDRTPTLTLVPQMVDALHIPIVAGGGIADGRGMAAVMALGAEAVYLGTRFIASLECPAHPSYKKAILEAADNGTTTCAGLAGVLRALKTPLVEHYVKLESGGKASAEDRMRLHRSSSRAWLEGDWNEAAFPCGAGAGLVKGIKSADEIIQSIIQGYRQTQKTWNFPAGG